MQSGSSSAVNQNPNDLDVMNIATLFWRYAIPSVLGMLVTGVYVIVDGIFVGRYVGSVGLAAINLGYPLVMLQIGLGLMISMGASTRISVLQGAGKRKEAKAVLVNSLWLMLLFGVLFSVVGFMGLESILQFVGADREAQLLFETREYLWWMLSGSLLVIGHLLVTYLMRNDGRPRLVTALLVLGASLNIVLDYLFVVEWHYGLAGSAIATLAAEAVVVILGVAYFFSPLARLRLSVRDLKPTRTGWCAIFVLGASSLMMELNLAFVLFAHNTQLLRYGTEADVASFAVAGYTEVLFVLVVQGLAVGMQPLLSYTTGAQRPDRTLAVLKLGMKVTLICGVMGFALVEGIPEVIAALYAGDNAALIAGGAVALRLHLMAMPIDGLITVSVVGLQAMEKTGPALVGTVGKTILLIPFLWWMPHVMGIMGVWLAMPVVNVLLGVLVLGLVWHQVRALKQAEHRLELAFMHK